MSFVSWPVLRLDCQDRLNAIADGAGQVREPDGKVFRGGDDFAVAQRKGGPPLLAPAFGVVVIFGPGELFVQLPGDIVQVKGVSRLSQPSTLSVGRSAFSASWEKWAKLICRSSPSP